MERLPRTLLEQLIQESDHTLDEWCTRFDRLARTSDVTATLSVRQLQRWMAGEVDTARASSRRVAAKLWGHAFSALIGTPGAPRDDQATSLSTDPSCDRPNAHARSQEATVIAHESMQHAATVGGSVDGMTIEQAQSEAWRIARSYTTMPPLAVLAESKRARDLVYVLLEQTRRPNQTRDLYLVAGQLCGLMAAASFDLAAWDASIEQARAAYVYGELINHPGLRAWIRGHQALIAYWTGNPHHAVTLAEAGLAEAPAEFGWGPSRHAACIGSALVQIGDGHAAAERIHIALRLLPTDQHSGLLAERALCDLANAELIRKDLDAAAEALTPVWRLPALRRSEGVTGRLLKAERMLVAKAWQSDRQAADIRERIVMFNAEASARALPATTG